jgi:DNA-binding response OmpR family regulator
MYRKILIVEDEDVLRAVIVRNLKARGFEAQEAASAEEALQMLQNSLPDLMLLDINLPDRTGWDVLRELRKQGKSVPFIVISAVRASQSLLGEFHAIAYLPKPFPLESLLQILEQSPESAAPEREEGIFPGGD